MKFEDRTDTAKLRKQAVAIYIAVEKTTADDIAASLHAAANEIDFLRPKFDEAAAIMKKAHAEHMDIKTAGAEVVAENLALTSKLARVSRLLSDWEEAEREGLGLSIWGGIKQLREALK